MDATTLVVIISALAGGIALGYVVATRRTVSTVLRSAELPTLGGAEGEALANLMMYLGDPVEMRPLLGRAAEWLKIETAAAAVVIYPYNSAAQELVDPIQIGIKQPDITFRFRLGVGTYGEVGSNRETRLIENAGRDPRFQAASSAISTAYIVPLYAENTLLGVASIQSTNPDSFSEERRKSIDQYAGLVSIQAMVARRFTDSRQAIERFGRFQELSQTLVTQLDLTDLLKPVVNAAREMLDTQMSILLEVRAGDDRLHPVAWSGITDETALTLESRMKEDLKGLVAWAQLPARTHNLKTDQRTARATQAVVAGMLSELAAPVMYAESLYGVLAVETNVYRNFSDEESYLLQSLAAQAGIALRNAQLYSRLKSTNQQLEKSFVDLQTAQEEVDRAHAAEIRAYETELETAREIQTSLLPVEAPLFARVKVAARNIPAKVVSGDFYQYLMLPGGKLAIVIGDVSGKGTPAALLMAVTTTALRDQAATTQSASTILNELNVRLLDRMQSTNMNSALCIAVFDPETGVTEIANAGMVTPYLSNGRGWEAIEVGGYPLGAAKRSKYTSRNQILSSGAILVMVSDGIIECQNKTGEFYSFERFEALLKTIPPECMPEEVIDLIIESVSRFADGEAYQDDVTVVVIRAT